MMVLDHTQLLKLNESSVQSGRNQNLRPSRLAGTPQKRYWITYYAVRERDGEQEARVCVVLSLYAGQTAWLDISPDEFMAIPLIEVPQFEWETAMCAGTPPRAP